MDKFLQFESTDFAQEASFINWVNATNVSDINQWNKWIADHPEKREVVDKAKQIVSSIKFKEGNNTPNLEDKIWNNISKATQIKSDINAAYKPSGVISLWKKWVPLVAAAVIALLVYVNVSIGTDYDTNIKTTYAENSQELLPDGSVIDINAKSTLAYSKRKWDSNREIKLEGEAYFSVKKGSKFTVVTENGDVEVLGTSFNVYSRGDIFSVECETGKVSVTADGKEVILTPNESVRLDLTKNEVSKNEISNKRSAWRRGSYNYKGAMLQQVFEDIERHFNVSINTSDLPADLSYNGKFNGTNIDSVLHQVCWPLDLEISHVDKVYQISSSKK